MNIDWKAKFVKTYANLPSGLREEIVAVIGKEPFSWKAAKIEIDHDTKIGKEILKKLVELEILK